MWPGALSTRAWVPATHCSDAAVFAWMLAYVAVPNVEACARAAAAKVGGHDGGGVAVGVGRVGRRVVPRPVRSSWLTCRRSGNESAGDLVGEGGDGSGEGLRALGVGDVA